MMYEPIQLAWAAGIIDGEGCIRLAPSKNNGRPSYSVMLKVEMTHEETIIKLRRIWGCGGRHDHKGTNKPAFGLQANGEQAIHIIRRLLPYLVTKRLQAELVIEYWEQCQNAGGWSKEITVEIQAHRELIYEELKRLNGKWSE